MRKVLFGINNSRRNHETVMLLSQMHGNVTWSKMVTIHMKCCLTVQAYNLVASKVQLIFGSSVKCRIIKPGEEVVKVYIY